MLAQMTCEGLAPSMERHLTDMEPFAIFAEGVFEDNMHVGVRLIRVERQGVSMPRREYLLLCEITHGATGVCPEGFPMASRKRLCGPTSCTSGGDPR